MSNEPDRYPALEADRPFTHPWAVRLSGLLASGDYTAEQEWHDAIRGLVMEIDQSVASDGFHTFDELYAYRKAYNALLFNEWFKRGLYDIHKSKRHSDGELCFGGGWFIVVAQTPVGQISNHYKDEDWSLFNVPERERSEQWDGHTPAVALKRLFDMIHLSALRVAPLKAPQWQSIEMAPKDGTPILVDFESVGMHRVFWSEQPYGKGIGGWCVTDNKNDDQPLRGYVETDIRGWMPLPDPPVAGTRLEPPAPTPEKGKS